MTKYKVAFFDIDGTLADNKLPRNVSVFDRIPASAKKALIKLKENGIEPVIASGRNYGIVKPLVKQLEIDSAITSNGHFVVFQGNPLFKETLPSALLQEITPQLDAQNLDYLFETAEQIFAYENSQFDGDGTSKIQKIRPDSELPADILQLICRFDPKQTILLSHPDIIVEKVAPIVANIHAANISKASGIQHILEGLNLSPEEAIAFGDEENDFEMFHSVGLPVAMGNASDALKEKAKYITDAVHEDGIWNACVSLGLFH